MLKQLKCILFGILFFGGISGCGGDPNKEDLEKLQGKWIISNYIEDGKPKDSDFVWTIAENKVIYTPNASVYSIITIEASKNPKTIDFETIHQNPAKTEKGFSGIYEIDGETVRFCIAKPGKDRPITFESKAGSGHTLTVLKRVRDKK